MRIGKTCEIRLYDVDNVQDQNVSILSRKCKLKMHKAYLFDRIVLLVPPLTLLLLVLDR